MRIIPPLSEEQKVAFIAAARSYMGVKFRHQGRTRRGVDCVGHVVLSLRDIGLSPNDRTNYGILPYEKQLEAVLRDHFGPPVAGAPQPADVVLMKWAGEVCHTGIITPHPDYGIGIVHCYLSSQKVVEHGIDDTWRRRIVEVYR